MQAELIKKEAIAEADSRGDEVLARLAVMLGAEMIPRLGGFYSCDCAFFRNQDEFRQILRIYTKKKKAIHYFRKRTYLERQLHKRHPDWGHIASAGVWNPYPKEAFWAFRNGVLDDHAFSLRASLKKMWPCEECIHQINRS